MANREDWCSNQITKLLDEDSRLPTLYEIKDHFSGLPPDEAKRTAINFQLNSIFDCLNNSNVEQVDLACEVLTICMSHLSIGNSVNQYHVPIDRALHHPYSSVKIMALKEIERNLESEEYLIEFSHKTLLLKSILKCISDDDLGVAKIASEIICKICASTNCIHNALTEEFIAAIRNTMTMNVIVSLRINELFINVSKNSELSMHVLESKGLLNLLWNDLDSEDVLLKMNVIELLSQLVVTNHGYLFLESKGIISKILDEIDEDDAITLQLCEPGVLKFFGHMAHWKPHEILEKNFKIMDRIFSIIQFENSDVVGVALDTLGYIADSNEGKYSLGTLDQKMVKTLKAISSHIQTYPTDLKIRSLNCLESLFKIDEFDSKITNLVRKWYYAMHDNAISWIYAFATNPFNEIRFASFGVLHALAFHNWGQETFRNTPGFIEFLLDRRSENFKECKEAKYNIVQTLSTSSVFDHSTQLRLQAFVAEGPFYVQAITEVAIEGD